jgi:hypothetical protein
MRFAGCRNAIRALPGGHGKSFPRAAFHDAVSAAMGGVCSVCAWREDGGDGICLQTPSNLNDVLKLRVFSLFQNTDRNVHHETDFIRATAKH